MAKNENLNEDLDLLCKQAGEEVVYDNPEDLDKKYRKKPLRKAIDTTVDMGTPVAGGVLGVINSVRAQPANRPSEVL
jgi:hypothetical protein